MSKPLGSRSPALAPPLSASAGAAAPRPSRDSARQDSPSSSQTPRQSRNAARDQRGAAARAGFVKWTGYKSVRFVCRMATIAGLGLRCRGRDRLDAMQGALICSNHQSFLDPIVIGCAFDRRINYLARESLFRFPLGNLLRFLDAIPLDRDGLGLSGMKETLRRLRGGEPVLVFPEGTRSETGELGPLQPGICALARRGKAPILPVGIDGAFAAWPRHRPLPAPGRVEVYVGEPIPVEQWNQMEDPELLALLEQRLRHCQLEARRHHQLR